MSEANRVLVIDDDPTILRAVCEALRRTGHSVAGVSEPVEGIQAAADPSVAVVLSDVQMPNLSGLDVLRELKKSRPELEVILMTGHATVEIALEALKAGAYDFLLKPFERIELLTHAVTRAFERQRLRRRAQTLESELNGRVQFEGMIGQAATMRAVFQMIEAIAPSTATVLIEGESGTGKELIARAVHNRSARKGGPFLAVNCAALPETLIDSELFGHVKGSFTGASDHRKGLFEAANGGTLFLDEIGDIPPATQVRLLRALQEGEIKRVGANEVTRIDVRVVAATNVALEEARKGGRFRDDLYYRLSVIPLRLPPLRERPEDVPLLAQHFLRRAAVRMGKQVTSFSPEVLDRFVRYAWRGNVRELENLVERVVVLTPSAEVQLEVLPPYLQEAKKPEGTEAGDPQGLLRLPFSQAKALAVAAFERRYASAALERTGNNVSAAALAAGMDRSNFRRLLKEHRLVANRGGGEESSEGAA